MTPPPDKAVPGGDEPLTNDERLWIRQQIKQHEHEEWLRGQVRVLWPWVVSIIGAIVAAVAWIKEHVKL